METDDLSALTGSDLILLLLFAPTSIPQAQNRINGITRLEKLLFLLEKEGDSVVDSVSEPLEFLPYHFGPYSKAIYEAVDLLEDVNLLCEEQAIDERTLDSLEDAETGASEASYVERRFFLTSGGEAVSRLLAGRHGEVVQKLSAIKDRYAGLSLTQLIKYVYTKYPDSAINSRIKHQVL